MSAGDSQRRRVRAATLAGLGLACAGLLSTPVTLAQPDATVAATNEDVFAHPTTTAELRATLLAAALSEVERSRILEGRFVQRRSLRGIPRPLESSGEFLLVRDLGLQWHTLAPVDARFVLTRSGVKRHGRPAGRRTAPPGAATELLFALFSLDLATLERRFELYGAGSAQAWQVGLRPRDKSTVRAVRRATVSGGERVESIALVNGAGDELHIELLEVSVRASDLTPEQHALFE